MLVAFTHVKLLSRQLDALRGRTARPERFGVHRAPQNAPDPYELAYGSKDETSEHGDSIAQRRLYLPPPER